MIGGLTLCRQEVRPFTDKQIELVKNFAAQAVIAIENARLLNELRQRTDDLSQRTTDLTEALEQQTATSEVLQVISSSPGDLEPVFATMLENAVRICDAKFGNIYRWDDDALHLVATHNTPPAFAEARRYSLFKRPGPQTVTGRMLSTQAVVHVADATAERGYGDKSDPGAVAAVELGGVRTILAVPMRKEDELIGSFTVYRQEVRPFTDKQIALVTNFAAQAVIAIENARLLNELRQRTTDLTEALEQQTATSEVLKVISSSPAELQPVFDTILENATRICEAKFGNLFLRDNDETFRTVAMYNAPPAYAAVRMRGPIRPAPDTALGQLLRTKRVVQIADVSAEPGYLRRDPMFVSGVELAGMRTLLAVPMLKDSGLVGSINIYRQEVRTFTDKQVALVQNFAAQAVIAIENARLLNELRQSLEQQTATSEVLQVISSSPGDLQPVFETLLRNATQLCKAKIGTLFLHEEGRLRLVAAYDLPRLSEVQAGVAHEPAPGGPLEGAIRTRKAVQIADLAATEAYKQRHPRMVEAVELGGIRTAVAVPMLKDEEVIGVIAIQRSEVVPFDDTQVALLTSFAAQAVIAIENARLLNELRQSLEQQTATADVLSVISGSLGELEPVFQTMLQNATRLCEATFGTLYFRETDGFRAVAMHGAPPAYLKERLHALFPATPTTGLGRVVQTKQVVHVEDVTTEPAYSERDPMRVSTVEVGGVRTLLCVPMLKDGEVVGAIAIYRDAVRPFTNRHIELVTNFAAQAVIAIENTRLLKELRERTEEVEKLNLHLEQRVTDQVDEIERMSRLRRFLPPQVADLIVASGSEKQLESHRREITALFCDLRGFTGFTESADAEDVMALLRDYHAAIGKIIIKYNGTLERYAGDGVMVVFNDPVPVDNPALQAVLMALEVRDAIGGLTETWRRWGHDIGFGIGIAHGFATLGTIGFEGRFDYAAIGTVSNVASRLCDEAKPGQILISPRVLTKVEHAVTVEPVGEFELKGIRRPLAAYNVVSAASQGLTPRS